MIRQLLALIPLVTLAVILIDLAEPQFRFKKGDLVQQEGNSKDLFVIESVDFEYQGKVYYWSVNDETGEVVRQGGDSLRPYNLQVQAEAPSSPVDEQALVSQPGGQAPSPEHVYAASRAQEQEDL
jgi:hypothetical protein